MATRLAAATAAVALCLAATPLLAAPAEIAGFQFQSVDTASWQFLGGVSGYHLYRGDLLRLAAGDAGDCIQGSLRTTSARIDDDPPVGAVQTFFVAGFDETGHGDLGSSSAGVARVAVTPCSPARRYFDFSTNGDPGDGVIDGAAPRRNAVATTWYSSRETTGVFLHTGEFFYTAVDLEIAERGGAFQWGFADGVPGSGTLQGTPSGPRGGVGDSGLSLSSFDVTASPSTRQEGPPVGPPGDAGGSHGGVLGNHSQFNHDFLQLPGISGPGWSAQSGDRRMSSGGGNAKGGPLASAALQMASPPPLPVVAEPGILDPFLGAQHVSGKWICDALLKDMPSTEECGDMTGSNCQEWVQCCEQVVDEAYKIMELWYVLCNEFSVGGFDRPPLSSSCPICPTLLGNDMNQILQLPEMLGSHGSTGSGDRRRTYRSQTAYSGPLGHGWDIDDNERIAPDAGDVRHFDGRGRRDTFTRIDPIHFASPPGIYSVLIQNPDNSFTLRDPDGTLHDFHPFDGSNREGALKSVQDRNGNRTNYLYDHQGLLTTVVDTLGRVIDYDYDADGRVVAVTDFAGRSVVYAYDAAGNLASVRSPPVTGTPNGNDFPAGKTTRYTYTSGFADPRLNHNLTAIVPPNEEASGLPAVQNGYGEAAGSFAADRVIGQTIGGTNATGVPAGGARAFQYESLGDPGGGIDPTVPWRRTTVTDRNGNLKQYDLSVNGHCLTRTEFTNRNLRPGEPDYTAMFTYNPDGEVVEATRPLGNRVQLVYDRPGADRFREGNVLQIRMVAEGGGAGGGRGDGHGGPLADRLWSYAYEPLYNQPATMTEPRGNDGAYVPQNGGAHSPARYRTTFTYDYQEGDPAANGASALAARFGIDLGATAFDLGDLNGDGTIAQGAGSPVEVRLPAVLLDPASHQAAIQGGDTSQAHRTLYAWNDFGQVTAIVDREGNRHEHEYFPESDPDGDGAATSSPPDGRVLNGTTGGYLKTRRLDTASAPGRNNGTDPPPAMIRHDFRYDPMGHLRGFVDGRGVRTGWVWNALDQVVEVHRAAATADATADIEGPTGRGETGLIPFGFKVRYAYDANDNLMRLEVEDAGASRGAGLFVETTWSHDFLDNVVSESREVATGTSLTTQYRYDANENRTELTEPAGNMSRRAYDERDLLLTSTRGASGPRGGAPSTLLYDYDANGDLSRLTDARGGLVDQERDGHDRLTRSIDQIGDRVETYYDPAGNVVRVVRRGPAGGPTPADRSGSTNVDLAETRLLYDELSRPFRRDRALFVPAGVVPARPPILAEGPVLPGDGAINTRYEYDRASRLSFVVRDSGAVTRFDHDGLDRLAKTTLPGGAGMVAYTYDGDHNLVETIETENASGGGAGGGPPAEVFLTTSFYDALGRRTMTVDNVGQTRRAVHDSLDAVTATSDARGPAGGSILRHWPGYGTTVVPVNGHGNVTRYAYDGLGRALSTTRVLTATGEGDGTLSPIPDDNNVFNPDGLITETTVWDGNSLVAERVDDRGNTTDFVYDNLNRPVIWIGDDGTMSSYVYDPQGNVTGTTDPNGVDFTNAYDAAHRLVARSVAAAGQPTAVVAQQFEYDGLHRLTEATDRNDPVQPGDDVTVDFIHDSLSRLVEEGQQSGAAGSPRHATDYGWLADTLMTDLIYPDGRNIRYAYDAADRLVSVDDLDGARPEGATYQYFGLARVHTRTYAGGPVSTRMNDAGDIDIGFDGARRTTLLRHLDPAAGTVLAGFEYRYDRESQPTSHRRLHHADGLGNLKGEIEAFDSTGRLVMFQESFLDANHVGSNPPDDSIDWMLDGTSNWPEMTRNGVTYLATPNNMNEYGEPKSGGVASDDGVPDDFHDDTSTPAPDGLNFANDENGNLTFDGRHDLYFDPFDRLVRAVRASDGKEVARYTYDALGRRVTRVVTSSGPLDGSVSYRYGSAWTLTHEMMHSLGGAHSYSGGSFTVSSPSGWGSRTIEEGSGVGAPVRQIVYGEGRPLWQIHNTGGSEYFLEDPLGSTAALFSAGGGPGGGGGIVERVTYDPHGKPVLESAGNVPLVDDAGNFLPESQYGNTHLWLGMEYEPELGERTADPNSDWGGQFVSALVIADRGPSGLTLDIASTIVIKNGTASGTVGVIGQFSLDKYGGGLSVNFRRTNSRYCPNLGRFLRRDRGTIQVAPGKTQTASG